MAIDLKCTDCGCELEAPDNATGKTVKCPDCGARMTVPGAAKDAVKAQPGQRPVKRDSRTEVKPDPDQRPRRRRDDEGEDDEEDSDAISGLIPYKNRRALAAYYCGVFGLIPGIGVILGPIALILGILGLRYAADHLKAKGSGHAWAGVILGVVGPLVTVAVIILIHMEILELPEWARFWAVI